MWADPRVFGLNSSYPRRTLDDTMYDPLLRQWLHSHGTHQLSRIALGAEACPLAARICQRRLADTA